MSDWSRGRDSAVYRFEKHRDGKVIRVVEVEVFDSGEAALRPSDEPADEARYDSISDALSDARERWGLDEDALPGSPTVRVKREVLSLLADYAGSSAVFGHDVPAETRDALAAAYETLDRPGLPLSFYDCPDDGAALIPVSDERGESPHNDSLACPECGEVYLIDRDTGELRPD